MTSSPATIRPHYTPGLTATFQQMTQLTAATGAVNFSSGIPEARFDDEWTDALRAAVAPGRFQYCPPLGLPEWRATVARLHDVDADDVITTSGCSESVTIGFHAAAQLGCTRIVWYEPWFLAFLGMAANAALAATSIPLTDNGDRYVFNLDAAAEALAAPGRAVWLLNSPHNPTGATLGDHDWDRVLQIAEDTDSLVLFDDAYRDFILDGTPAPYRRLLDSGRVMVASSISKSLAASGNRVGWLLARGAARAAAADSHTALTYCVPAFMQHACVDMVARVWPQKMADTADAYRRRRDALVEGLRKLGGRVHTPSGGFFVVGSLPDDVTGGPHHTARDLVEHLARTHKVAPLPLDEAFTAPTRQLRWSFSLPDQVFDEGMARLARLG